MTMPITIKVKGHQTNGVFCLRFLNLGDPNHGISWVINRYSQDDTQSIEYLSDL